LLEEAALVAIVLLGLPKLGIHNFPIAVLIILMVALGVFEVFTYRMGSKALRQKPVMGLPDMTGSEGKVVSPLKLEGLVRIKGELWVAKSVNRKIDTGKEVIVVEQERLKLLVRKSSKSDLKRT